MKAQQVYLALAFATALVAVSPVIGGDAATTAVAAPDAAARTDVAPAAQSSAADGRARSNAPHPAVLSFERPVYPIGVPNPPVSLERY